MKPQQFTIPQQFMVGEIKIDTKAQLERTYMRLLLDAFVPYQEAMLAYLDELLVKHDPQLVQRQLDELQKQDRKKSKEWKQTHLLLQQTDESEHEKIIGRLLDIHDEERALHQTHMELIEKINSETRGRTPLTGERRRRACKKRRSWAGCASAKQNTRADGRIETSLPERGVFGTRQTWSGQEQSSWSQPTTLQVSQERPARAGVFWQELPPPGGELTAQDEGDDCHQMAPRAMTHSLSVRPPSPCLTSSLAPRCYTFATQKGPAWRVCCTQQGLLFTVSS
jgi:hypothetical protein